MRSLFILLTLTFVLFFLFFWVLTRVKWTSRIERARKSGLYPRKGKGTLFHVRELIINNEKWLAVHLYCEIYHVNFHDGMRAVGDLEKTIQEKRSS